MDQSSASKLIIGIVEFENPTVLVLGDAAAFLTLASRIQERQTFRMAESGFAELKNIREITVMPCEDHGEFSRIDDELVWKVSAFEADAFAAQLQALGESKDAGHTYLDPSTNSTDLEIVASKDEYQASVLFDVSRMISD